MQIQPLEQIRKLDPYAPGLSIDEIKEHYRLTQVIKLASNENPLGTSPLAREAIIRNAASVFRYPQGGNPALAAAIAMLHNVDPKYIAIGNGSDEIIDLLIRIMAKPGEDNIVCFEPCFSIYPIQGRIAGVETRRLPLHQDFSFNFDGLLQLIDDKTRLIFITTPDNPSGYCPSASSVEKLARDLAIKAPGALLVIDEAYMDFADKSYSLLVNGILPDNVVFLRTFSKSRGLAGLRIGYGIMPRNIAEAFWRARLPFSLNILAEKAALAALEDNDFYDATLHAVAAGRAFLKNGLEAAGCFVWPSQTNFLMFQLPPDTLTAKQCFEALLERGIIIRPLRSYGLPDNLRVSIGNEKENNIFLKALNKLIAEAKCRRD